MKPPSQRSMFVRFAKITSQAAGRPVVFLTAIALVIVWGLTGPYFHYSTDWQLVINTGTTIITFLMVFLIQNTQNRDARALHLKVDELLRAIGEARTRMVNLEKLSESELDALEAEFERVRNRACRTEDPQIPEAEAST
jgi:low affinity Fe/Cu permease